MFDRYVFSGDQESRRPWTFSVSLLAQLLLVVVAILVPLLSKPLMPALSAALISLELPRPPRSAPPPPQQAVVAPPPEVFHAELRRPRQIPPHVVMTPAEAANAPALLYIEGAAPNGPANAIISDFTSVVPPSRPPAVEPETAPEPAAIRVSSTVQAARILHRVQPVYPKMAIAFRVGGVVRLRAVIAPDGTISELEAIEGHPMLIPAAIAAVSQWRYRPVLLAGSPVPVNTQIDVNFKLGR